MQIGIDLSEFYLSVEWDILEVPATKNEEYYPDTLEPFSGEYIHMYMFTFKIKSLCPRNETFSLTHLCFVYAAATNCSLHLRFFFCTLSHFLWGYEVFYFCVTTERLIYNRF